MSDDSAKFPASENQEHSASESLESDAVEVPSDETADVTSADGIATDALDAVNGDAIASIEGPDIQDSAMEVTGEDRSLDEGESEPVPETIPETVPDAVLDEEMAAIQEYYGSDVTPTELTAELAAQAGAATPGAGLEADLDEEPVAPLDLAEGVTDPGKADVEHPEAVESETETETEHSLFELESVSQDLEDDGTTLQEPEIKPGVPSPAEARSAPPQRPAPSPPQASNGVVRQVWGRVQPVLKSGTVWSLQTAVRGLNWSTEKLDSAQRRPQEPIPGTKPPSTVQKIGGIALAALVTTSLLLVRSLSNLLQWGLRNLDANALPQETVPASEPTPVESAASSLWEKIAPVLTQIWRLWRRLLAVLRDRILPDSLKRLSDLTLTVMAAALLATMLWITSAITSGGGTPSVAKTPPPAESPAVAPGRGSTSAQQKVLAAAQADMTNLVGDYDERLAQTVETDIQSDRLIVTLGYDWYRLEPDQQNRLARDLLRRSQELDIKALEILDPEGIRVARSPVVGSQMIIFKRTSDTLPEEPPPVELTPELAPELTTESMLEPMPEVPSDASGATELEESSGAEPDLAE